MTNSSEPPSPIPSTKASTAVQVAVRIRPPPKRDSIQPPSMHLDDANGIVNDSTTITAQQKTFHFDHVFDSTSTQEQVFEAMVSGLLDKFLDGHNATVMAYGQTSSGKTYTMGTTAGQERPRLLKEQGIIPRAAHVLFDRLQTSHCNTGSLKANPSSTTSAPFPTGIRLPRTLPSTTAKLRSVSMITTSRRGSSPHPSSSHPSRYTVNVSFVEIYNEELVDLLNTAPPGERAPIVIQEDRLGHIHWTGVKTFDVKSPKDILKYLDLGSSNRATGSTEMNRQSSRSHAIFTITLRQQKRVTRESGNKRDSRQPQVSDTHPHQGGRRSLLGRRINSLNVKSWMGHAEKQAKSRASSDNAASEWVTLQSKFHFVDLAGSERLKRTAAKGKHRKEGISINSGLLALGNVINALADPAKRSSHINYRDSKLTRLLQDSLGGSAATAMIACVSPARADLDETVNTLNYASRARHIHNKTERHQTQTSTAKDSPASLRAQIIHLKNQVRLLKRATSATAEKTPNTIVSLRSSSTHGSGTSQPQLSRQPSSSAKTTVPDSLEVDAPEALVADLHRQVEVLQHQVTVTRERNNHVEKELAAARSLSDDLPHPPDRQTGVDPSVTAAYENTIARLQSEIALVNDAHQHVEARLSTVKAFDVTRQDLADDETLPVANPRQSLALESSPETQHQSIQETRLIQALHQQIQGKEKQIEALQQQLLAMAPLQQTRTNLEKAHQQQIEDLTASLTTAKAECASAKQQLADESERRQALEAQSNRMIQQLELRLRDVLAKEEQYARELEKSSSKVSQLRKFMWDQEQGTQSVLRTRLEHLEKVKVELQRHYEMEAKQQAMIYQLEAKIASMASLADVLQRQLTERDDTIAALETENTQQSLAMKDIETKTRQMVRTVAGMKSDGQQLSMVMRHVDNVLRRHDTITNQLTWELDELHLRTHVQEEELERHQSQLQELLAEKQVLTEELEQVTESDTTNQDRIQALTQELQRVKDTLDTQYTLMKKLKQDQLEATIEVQRTKALESRVVELDNELALLQDERAELETALHDKQTELAQVNAALERQLKIAQELEESIRSLEQPVQVEGDAHGSEAKLEHKQAVDAGDEKDDDLYHQFDQAMSDLERTQKRNHDQKRVIEALETSLHSVKTRLDHATARQTYADQQIQWMQEQLNAPPDTPIPSSSYPITLPDPSDQRRAQLTSEGERDLLQKLTRLAKDNAQLVSQVRDLEGQLALQKTKMSVDAKQLELEVRRLATVNQHLEKAFEIVPRQASQAYPIHDVAIISSPPQSPHTGSPILPRSKGMTQSDDQLTSGNPAKEKRQGHARGNSELYYFPLSSPPPTNPLPPVPSEASSDTASLPPQPPPSRSVSLPLLQRQNSGTTATANDVLDSNITAEQYQIIIHALQQKMHVAENNVRAHQEVISKLEAQLTRSEESAQKVREQLAMVAHEKHASSLEMEDLREHMAHVLSQHELETKRISEQCKALQEQLDIERKQKQRAEQAREILESRMEVMMKKRRKFGCF